jgi:hypothetical protein
MAVYGPCNTQGTVFMLQYLVSVSDNGTTYERS